MYATPIITVGEKGGRSGKKRRKTNGQARNLVTIRPEEEPIGREGNNNRRGFEGIRAAEWERRKRERESKHF
jgi:hypothetical protein